MDRSAQGSGALGKRPAVRNDTTLLVSAGSGSFLGVAAGTVNVRNSAAHGPQIRRQLPAMMHTVVVCEANPLCACHLEHAKEVDGFGERLARQIAQRSEFLRERLLVECDDVADVL